MISLLIAIIAEMKKDKAQREGRLWNGEIYPTKEACEQAQRDVREDRKIL